MNKRKYGQTIISSNSNNPRKYVKAGKKSDTKTVSLQQQITRLKSAMVHNAPPIKTKWNIFDNTVTNEWTGIGIAYPALGGANNQRLGQDIKVKSLQGKGTISVAESDDFDTVRFVVMQYLDSNTSDNYPYGDLGHCVQQTWLDLNTGDYPYIMPFKTQTKSAYRVLYDKTFFTDKGGNAQVPVEFLITAKDLAVSKLHFLDNEDTSVNLPGLSEGLIVCFGCSDSTTSPHPRIQMVFKLNYVDT